MAEDPGQVVDVEGEAAGARSLERNDASRPAVYRPKVQIVWIQEE